MLDQEWLIGSAEDCDLLIDAPTVSAHHCRLARIGKRYFLEDCGSTNGTYCDGQRLTEKTAVQPGSAITLGRSFPCPWPDSAAAKQIVFVGRDKESDYWINRPNVSSLHARFMVGHAGTLVLEDLDSTNGVAIDLRGVRHRVRKAVAVEPEQTVYFGSTPVTVEALIKTASNKTARPLPVAEAAESAQALQADRLAIPGLASAMQPTDAPYTFHGPRLAAWFGVGALLAVGIFVVLSMFGGRLKERLSGEDPTIPKGFPHAFAQPPFSPVTTPIAAGPLYTDPTTGSGDAALRQPAGGVSKHPDTAASAAPRPGSVAQKHLFWVLACDASGEPAFRLGIACCLDGKRLITTGSVVEALQALAQQGYPHQQVVHCQSKQRIPVTDSGVHPLFAQWLARSRILEQQYFDLRAIAQAAVPDTDEVSGTSPNDERVEAEIPPSHEGLPDQMKQLANEEVALRDRMLCYDVGWLNVPPEQSLADWKLGPFVPTLSRPLQSIQLAVAVIDAEDPYFDATADVLAKAIGGRVHRLVRPPATDTGRMEIRINESLEGWNLAGAPVLDDTGRVLGIYVQRTAPMDESEITADERGDVVLPTVILETLRTADSALEKIR